MASAVRFRGVRVLSQVYRHLGRLTQQRAVQTTSVLGMEEGNSLPWNYIWKPKTKIPVTEEEKEAAAKKYGLLKEDYKPLEDMGDYPDLPSVGAWARDDFYQWDMPEAKRNYMEPGIHFLADYYTGERYAEEYPDKRYKVSLRGQILTVLSIVTTIVLYEMYAPKAFFPMFPPQKPFDSQGNKIPHYSLD